MNRAQFLTGISSLMVAALAWGRPLRAEDLLDLGWGDLIPGGGTPAEPIVLTRHNEKQPLSALPYRNSDPAPIRTDLDGAEVRVTGYMIPLDYTPGSDGTRVSQFLLAPFIGACIHVPPPPANQLILCNFAEGIEISLRIWVDPLVAIGRMGAKSVDIDLAKVGYQMQVSGLTFAEA